MPLERRYVSLTLSLLVTAAGCGSDENPFHDEPAAGTAGSAGTATNAGSGGGAGSSSTAGAPGSAGTSSASGGSSAAGTGNAGGSAAGSASGGTTNEAGSGAGGGAAGSASGGTTNEAGSSAGGSSGAAPTSGCDATDWPPAAKQTLAVEGTERAFIVALPADYDPSRPHRLVFAFHGLTGTAEQIAGSGRGNGYYGLASRMGSDTIFIAPQGLAPEDEPDQYGWPNTNGRDIAFVRAMIDWSSDAYCVDRSRIFSVGMSYGGIMSNTIGCQMADVFRAIAPIAGALFGRGNSCMGPPIAAWMAHGTADETVTYAQGEAARDTFLAKNGCDTSAEPEPVEPAGCVSYQGCAEGHPVIWCAHDGGHIVPSFTGEAVSAFFSGF